MLCEAPEQTGDCAPFALYCVTGYCAGHRECVLPKEAMADNAVAIKSSWIIENWNKWVYKDCDVSEVKVIV